MRRSPSHDDPALDRVRAAAQPIAVSHGVELVDVAWSSDRGARVLRVVIELEGLAARGLRAQLDALRPGGHELAEPPDPAGGVSLDDCARFSRDLSEALDAGEVLSSAYVLEVSSPGLERALLSVADFVRFRGLSARVKLTKPAADGQKLLRGTIEGFDGIDLEALSGAEPALPAEATITMRVDGKRLCVPFAHVDTASLVYVFAEEAAARGVKRARPSSRAASTDASARPGGSGRSATDTKSRPARAKARAEASSTSPASRTRSRT